MYIYITTGHFPVFNWRVAPLWGWSSLTRYSWTSFQGNPRLGLAGLPVDVPWSKPCVFIPFLPKNALKTCCGDEWQCKYIITFQNPSGWIIIQYHSPIWRSFWLVLLIIWHFLKCHLPSSWASGRFPAAGWLLCSRPWRRWRFGENMSCFLVCEMVDSILFNTQKLMIALSKRRDCKKTYIAFTI